METTQTAITALKEEFNALNLLKVFEIPVIDNRSGEDDFIIFHVNFEGTKLIAQHEALNRVEDESDKVPFKEIEICEYSALDYNLNALHEECINAILDSEYFNLREDD